MSTTDADLTQRVRRYLEQAGHPASVQIVPLTPDASDRRYFRIVHAEGPTVVLAVHTGPIDYASMPFADVSELLARMALPAPAVRRHDDALGVIELEDLGDVTLQAHLAGDAISRHMGLYEEAVTLVARLQQQGQVFASDRYVPYRLAFDVEKLTFELNFFVQHFLEGHRRVELSAAERTALGAEWRAIVDELAAEPRVLCHRDYHSRNLMVKGGHLHLIDFQDARLGPDTYDLASLLRDSYVDISEAEVEHLIAHFRALVGAAEAAEFRRRFDLMSVQRNIKALGTFGFQASARNNPAYLRDVPRTLRNVKRNLLAYSRFGRLHELLGAHVEELR